MSRNKANMLPLATVDESRFNEPDTDSAPADLSTEMGYIVTGTTRPIHAIVELDRRLAPADLQQALEITTDRHLKPLTLNIMEAGRKLFLEDNGLDMGPTGNESQVCFFVHPQEDNVIYAELYLRLAGEKPQLYQDWIPNPDILFEDNEIAKVQFQCHYDREDDEWITSIFSGCRKGFEGQGITSALVLLSNLALKSLKENAPAIREDQKILATIEDRAHSTKFNRKGWTSKLSKELGYKQIVTPFEDFPLWGKYY